MSALNIMLRDWRRLVLIASMALSVVVGPPALAEQLQMQLAPDDALAMAQRALEVRRPDIAVKITTQILNQNPKNARAGLILAAAYSRQGDGPRAEMAGRKAFRLSTSPDARFEAAFVTASALSAQDKPLKAKFWLRRADTHAQSNADTRLLRKAFQNLDRRTPWKLSLHLTGGPSDNVNGGSLHDTFWIAGVLPVSIAQALPGFALQGQAKLSYRIKEDASQSFSAFAAINGQAVQLNGRARTLDPAARDSDYGSVGLDLGVNYRARVTDKLGFGVEAQIGQRRLAHDAKRNSQRLKFTVDQALFQGQILSGALGVTGYQDPDGVARSSVAITSEASLWMPVGKGAVTARLGYDTVLSAARGVAWRGPSLGVDWQAPPVAKSVDLSVFGTVQMKDYWKTSNDPDIALSVGGAAKFNRLSVMGFVPTFSVSASRTASQVVVRDTADTSLTLGLSSKF